MGALARRFEFRRSSQCPDAALWCGLGRRVDLPWLAMGRTQSIGCTQMGCDRSGRCFQLGSLPIQPWLVAHDLPAAGPVPAWPSPSRAAKNRQRFALGVCWPTRWLGWRLVLDCLRRSTIVVLPVFIFNNNACILIDHIAKVVMVVIFLSFCLCLVGVAPIAYSSLPIGVDLRCNATAGSEINGCADGEVNVYH